MEPEDISDRPALSDALLGGGLDERASLRRRYAQTRLGWSWCSIIAGGVVVSFRGVAFLWHVGGNVEVVCRKVLTPFHGRVGHATGLLRSFLIHRDVKSLQFPGFLPWVSM